MTFDSCWFRVWLLVGLRGTYLVEFDFTLVFVVMLSFRWVGLLRIIAGL